MLGDPGYEGRLLVRGQRDGPAVLDRRNKVKTGRPINDVSS